MPDRRIISLSAAGMYAGAVLVEGVEEAIPGGAQAAVGPGIVAMAASVLLVLLGPRLPKSALFLAGPVGAGLIGWAVATTHGYSDGAVLYIWPVLWTAAFFGARGAIAIVVCVAVAHGIALLEMEKGQANFDRWVDVTVAVSVVATVVRMLAARNQRLQADLVAEARTDALTGLLNRRGLRERLKVELERSARDGTPIAVALFDIDRFKEANDGLGHEVGDRILAKLGAILADELRGVDIAARLGGDEFGAFMPNSNEHDGAALADRVRERFAAEAHTVQLRLGATRGPQITLSAGIACSSGTNDDIALRSAADEALYAAKSSGRNRVISAPALVGAPT
jgi:diguanylate cyclase (GGDEF)-like protein